MLLVHVSIMLEHLASVLFKMASSRKWAKKNNKRGMFGPCRKLTHSIDSVNIFGWLACEECKHKECRPAGFKKKHTDSGHSCLKKMNAQTFTEYTEFIAQPLSGSTMEKWIYILSRETETRAKIKRSRVQVLAPTKVDRKAGLFLQRNKGFHMHQSARLSRGPYPTV